MKAQLSGWRNLSPMLPQVSEPYTTDKQDLYEASRLAMRALSLPSSCRFVLEHLCGAYGGKLIGGKMVVWPSNSFLEERTGISERTIRFALARLIEAGVIGAVDSPNGKRYARRNLAGEITVAYGFDLSPIINRISEFTDIVTAQKERERERKAAFDALTIHRRATQEALRAIAEHYPEIDTSELTARVMELMRNTPRRTSKGSTVPSVEQWVAIRSEAETVYYAANGGNNCRHKDNNKYASEKPCNNGKETNTAETPEIKADLRDLALACPDAMEFMGNVRSDMELINAADRFRGMFGVSPSGWESAKRDIGTLAAAATLIFVVQMQIKPSPGSEQIKNLGGYYRAMCRLIQSGRIDLDREIRKLGASRISLDG